MSIHGILALQQRIEARLSADQMSALREDLEGARVGEDAIHSTLTIASKRSGRRHLVMRFAERAQATVSCTYGALKVGEWRVDEAVKVWLLSALATETADPNRLLFEVYARGDTEAKVACLRALNFTTGSIEAGLELVHDAGRTYLNELMEAGWRDSLFSARHLSAEEYRKAVLKALFCQVEIEGFMGLEERADAELARSLCAYANEREAAGREVPSALWPVAARFPSPGLVARLIGRLEHPSALEREIAARSLLATRDERAHPFLQDRLSREEDPSVREALEEALSAPQRESASSQATDQR